MFLHLTINTMLRFDPQKDDFRNHIAINNFEKGGRIEVNIDTPRGSHTI